MKLRLSFVGLFYAGLIATLPLFSVRFLPGGVSLPFMFILLLAGIAAIRAMFTLRIPMVFSSVDCGIGLYLAVALVTLNEAANPESVFAYLKSVVYFLSYLGLKMALIGLPSGHLLIYTRRGLLFGSVLFGGITLVSLQQINSLNVLTQALTYDGLTVRVFSAIDAAFGQDRTSFTSVDVMRNAVAEAFAFYTILAMTLGFRSRSLTVVVAGANTLFALGMFSRRALLAIVLGVMGRTMQRGIAARRMVAICAPFAIAFFAMGSPEETRLTDFSDQVRVAQYSEATQRFAVEPMLGHGYAAKLSTNQYVHNFVLAGMMMMGILGLAASLAVFVTVVSDFLRGLFNRNGPWTSSLLIIPIFGMSVGSTVEGILTIVGWVAIAIHDVCRRGDAFERRAKREGPNG